MYIDGYFPLNILFLEASSFWILCNLLLRQEWSYQGCLEGGWCALTTFFQDSAGDFFKIDDKIGGWGSSKFLKKLLNQHQYQQFLWVPKILVVVFWVSAWTTGVWSVLSKLKSHFYKKVWPNFKRGRRHIFIEGIMAKNCHLCPHLYSLGHADVYTWKLETLMVYRYAKLSETQSLRIR